MNDLFVIEGDVLKKLKDGVERPQCLMLPEDIRRIGAQAFSDCYFETVDLRSMQQVGWSAFYNCKIGTLLLGGDGIIKNAFKHCQIEEMMVEPFTHTEMGGFEDCEIGGISFDSEMRKFSMEFKNCHIGSLDLSVPNMAGNSPHWYNDVLFEDCTFDDLILGGSFCEKKVFENCEARKVTLAENMQKIYWATFDHCRTRELVVEMDVFPMGLFGTYDRIQVGRNVREAAGESLYSGFNGIISINDPKEPKEIRFDELAVHPNNTACSVEAGVLYDKDHYPLAIQRDVEQVLGYDLQTICFDWMFSKVEIINTLASGRKRARLGVVLDGEWITDGNTANAMLYGSVFNRTYDGSNPTLTIYSTKFFTANSCECRCCDSIKEVRIESAAYNAPNVVRDLFIGKDVVIKQRGPWNAGEESWVEVQDESLFSVKVLGKVAIDPENVYYECIDNCVQIR